MRLGKSLRGEGTREKKGKDSVQREKKGEREKNKYSFLNRSPVELRVASAGEVVGIKSPWDEAVSVYQQ